MIKLPSIKSLLTQIGSIVKRFPFVVISAFLLTASFTYITHQGLNFKDPYSFFWTKLSMCSALGLSLFLATTLLSEAKEYSLKGKILAQFITLAFILAYYFSIEKYENFNLDSFTRYSLYIIAAHLFVAFSAFTSSNQINGFWQFNKTLFLRFLLSALYTSVLYGGIALAFWLIDELLHFKIEYTKYLYIWYVLAGVLNTFIFLAGVPKDLSALENDISYPKGLKAFTQFVLLPLITLYLLILYVYFGKIIIHWNLPKGYVSYLIVSFSFMGILSLLLIYPLRDTEENKWTKIFSKWFYVALYPLIILLGISIYQRIAEYGITENRYFILVLAAWLVIIASYFLLSKKENIKIIPVTLFAIAILTSAGPWGAFSVSRHSQKNRLEKLLITNGILVNGKIIKATKKLNDSTREDISSIMGYLEESNSIDMLQPWFTIHIDSIHNTFGYKYKADTLLTIMGIYESYNYSSSGNFELTASTTPASILVKGFDYYSQFSYYCPNNSDSSLLDTTKCSGNLVIGGDSLSFIPYHFPCRYALMNHRKFIAIVDISGFVSGLRNQLDSTNSLYTLIVPNDKFIYEVTGSDSTLFHFQFSYIQANKINTKFYLYSINAVVLTKHL